MIDWILAHIDSILAVGAALLGAYKAYKAGTLNAFLAKKVEGLADPADKEAIKAEAIAAGVQGLLGKVVVNAGLSSKKKPAGIVGKALGAVLPLVLGAVLLGGCSAVEPYRLSVKGMVDTGNEVDANLIKSPLTGGEQALLDAWRFQRAAGQKLVDAGK